LDVFCDRQPQRGRALRKEMSLPIH
jgi:hypothetical protein